MSEQLKPAPAETSETALHKGRLGVAGIVFFVVAAAAPLVGMTGAVPVAIVLGNGAAAPGAYVAVGITLLLFSVGYAAMSHRVTNTGAFFAYVGRGLGIGPGVGSAFVSLVAYLAVQLAIFGFFGAVASGLLADKLSIDWPWYVWSLIAWAIVTVLSLASVDIGAKVLGVFMTVEVLSLFIMALAVIFTGGGPEGFDLGASFAPNNILVGGLTGTAGIALAFAFASYIGFEATAIYGEESRDPKRTVPRATYIAVILITVLFGLATFAIVSYLGSSQVVDRVVELGTVDVPLDNPAAVLFTVAQESVADWLGSWAGTLVSNVMEWLVLSSLFAGLLAFQNSAARYFFSLGRAQVLPAGLARVNRLGSPQAATLTTSAISLVVILLFWIFDKDPVLNLFYWFSGLAVLAIVLVEILVSVAVIAHFRRTREDTRVWNTLVAPVLAIIGLALGMYLLMSRFNLLAGTVADGVDPSLPESNWKLNTLGWFLIALPFVTFIVGWVVGVVRRSEENSDAVRDLVS